MSGNQFLSENLMAQPETWKELGEYSGKVWGVLGPLVGVLVGAYIANRNQKKHWIADNKRAEYRELLSTVHRNSMKMAAICTAPRSNPGLTVEEQKEYDELNLEVVQVMDDRLFINHEINDRNDEEPIRRINRTNRIIISVAILILC